MKKIVPTVGRKVWFWPCEADLEKLDAVRISDQPFDATVVHIDGDTGGASPDFIVKLSVFDHEGNQLPTQTAMLLMPEDYDSINARQAVGLSYATWMPYQSQQAAKS